METIASYGEPASVRPECLRAHSDWTEPTANEVRAVMKMANWSGEELGRRVGVTGRTVRRWLQGEKAITYPSWCVLCAQAGLGNIWMFAPLDGENSK